MHGADRVLALITEKLFDSMKTVPFRWRLLARSWIRSPSIVHRLLLLVIMLVVLVVSSIVNADETSSTDVDRAFAELVRNGDKARFAGNTSTAINAYQDALKLRNDPRIVGRIGLVALDGGATAESMNYLLRAILNGNRIPTPERQQIERAFNRTLNLVTRVDIDVSHLGADVFIDGEPERLGTTAGEFYVFILPGKHEVKATLAGHNAAVVSIDAPKGGTIRVKLVLTPIPLNETVPEPAPVVTCEPCKQNADSTNATITQPTPPASTTPNHTADDDERVQWMPGIGATVVYGAVSPYPAGGFVLSSQWKLNSVMSFGFDFRAAMSPRGIEGYAIRGTTLSLLPSVCVTREWFTGCLVGHAGIMWHSSNAPRVSIIRPAVGGGASFGAKFARYKSVDFHAKLFGELLLDEYPIQAGAGGIFTKALWTGPQFLTGVSIMAVWHGAK